jgi:hypothetical protein
LIAAIWQCPGRHVDGAGEDAGHLAQDVLAFGGLLFGRLGLVAPEIGIAGFDR